MIVSDHRPIKRLSNHILGTMLIIIHLLPSSNRKSVHISSVSQTKSTDDATQRKQGDRIPCSLTASITTFYQNSLVWNRFYQILFQTVKERSLQQQLLLLLLLLLTRKNSSSSGETNGALREGWWYAPFESYNFPSWSQSFLIIRGNQPLFLQNFFPGHPS